MPCKCQINFVYQMIQVIDNDEFILGTYLSEKRANEEMNKEQEIQAPFECEYYVRTCRIYR